MYSPNDGVTSFSQWAQMPGSAAMAASRSRAGAHGLDVTEDVVQREARDGEGCAGGCSLGAQQVHSSWHASRPSPAGEGLEEPNYLNVVVQRYGSDSRSALTSPHE